MKNQQAQTSDRLFSIITSNTSAILRTNTGIYRRVSSEKYPWISQNSSEEHVYWDCYWCKCRSGVVAETAEDMQNDALRNAKQDFIIAHRGCRDMSVQMEFSF